MVSMHGIRLLVKNSKFGVHVYSSDNLTLFKFRQLVVNIVIKELQIVFWTSTVSNRNMEELELKL